MNWSRYNFLFNSNDHGYLLYNSLTNSFAQIEEDTYLLFEKVKQNPAVLTDNFSTEEIDQLREAKIIVDNDYDEYLNIKLQRHLKRFDKSRMTLTIAPTLHCNLACDYCFEEARPNVYMSNEVEEGILNFLKRHTDVKMMSITWYGGEPLLDFDRVVSLTQKIKKLDIAFQSSVITNGYLLTDEVIGRLIDLHIKQVHITIDGPEEIHNKRRPHIKEQNSYEVIYNNMLKLKPLLKEKKLALSVRVNIDHTNRSYYHTVYNKVRSDFKGLQVSVYPGIVKKSYGSCSSVDDILMDNQEQANFNIEQYLQHGIKSADFFPVKVNGECMARQLYGYLIDARGDIYKCWTDVGQKKDAIGNILDKTTVNAKQITRYLTGSDMFDKQECQECFFLPVCGGGCPHMAIKKMMGHEQIDLCHVAKGNLDKFLSIYYDIKNREKVSN